MLNCPDLDPAIANAAYMEFRACAGWLFDDASEEMRARRRYALEAIEELRPATALEARVAGQAIASDAHAVDCLRLAVEHRDDLAKVMRCLAQANAMTRQMDRALRTLGVLRRERRVRELTRPLFAAAPEAAREAGPEPPEAGRGASPEPPVAAGGASSEPPAAAGGASPEREPVSWASDPAARAKAERFAAGNPLLASRIRAAGGLTATAIAGFRPSALPDAATVRALVHGVGPVVAARDRANEAGG
jgi:hypothetical protein